MVRTCKSRVPDLNVGTPNTCRKLATKGIEEIKTPYEVRKGMNPIATGAQPHQRGGADTRHGDVRAQRQARRHSGRPNIIRHTHQRKKWVSKSNTTPTFPKEAGRKRTNHKVRQKSKVGLGGIDHQSGCQSRSNSPME